MPDWKKIISPWSQYGPDYYKCFACSPFNPNGLHLQFFEDGDDVVCRWEPTRDFESWCNVLHGGIQATLMDEAAGWAISRKLQTCGVTTRMNIKYRKTVPAGTGKTVEIRCRITEMKRNFAFLTADIRVDGEICTESEMTYCCTTKERALSDYRFSGCAVEGEDAK